MEYCYTNAKILYGYTKNSSITVFPRLSPSLPRYRAVLRSYTYPTNNPTKTEVWEIVLVVTIA